MTEYRRLKVTWYNSLDCELGHEVAFNERDASDKLHQLVNGAELAAGDYFKVTDLGATG